MDTKFEAAVAAIEGVRTFLSRALSRETAQQDVRAGAAMEEQNAQAWSVFQSARNALVELFQGQSPPPDAVLVDVGAQSFRLASPLHDAWHSFSLARGCYYRRPEDSDAASPSVLDRLATSQSSQRNPFVGPMADQLEPASIAIAKCITALSKLRDSVAA